MLPQRIKRGEVKRRTKTCTQHRWKRPAPELLQGIGTGENLAYGTGEGRRSGLLDTGFENVGRLEEGGGQATSCETGEEVESWETRISSSRGLWEAGRQSCGNGE